MESRRYVQSQRELERAQRVVPGGVQSSRRPWIEGASPVFIHRGNGCRVWDVDGNVYVDYTLGLGPIILGYADPAVTAAVNQQLTRGTLFTLNSVLQTQLAEELVRLVPCAETVLFFKTGSDATTAAVRIARTCTGRELVLRCGYHGWHDWCFLGNGVPAAVRAATLPFAYNDLRALEQLFEERPGQVAAVILMPGGEAMHAGDLVLRPAPGFLEGVRGLCDRNGAVLVFDEIRSGFRMALGGSQERFGVTPDLTTLSKALANGFPLSAVVGRREVMEAAERTLLSSTFNGDALGLAAGLATLGEIQRRAVVAHLWLVGESLLEGLSTAIAAAGVPAEAVGYPPMPMLVFRYPDPDQNREATRVFYTEVLAHGIMVQPGHHWFVSAAHTPEDITHTLTVMGDALEEVARAVGTGAAGGRASG